MKTRIRQLTEQEKRSKGEQQMIADWLEIFPKGILSIVSDTFDLWKLITEYLPANKEAIMARDGKLVIRPDSGDPVDIICGTINYTNCRPEDNQFDWDRENTTRTSEMKGVIELLWDIFGGTENEQGYKVLNSHIGAIYGDSINLERQVEIYKRLEAKGFAATNIVVGVGSFSYVYMTRDQAGYAAKGAWFEIAEEKTDYLPSQSPEAIEPASWTERKGYNIYKDPVTDDGTKKSLKGLIQVYKEYDDRYIPNGEYKVKEECTWEEINSNSNELKTIYKDGTFFNQTTLTEIREKLK